jgi:divinyl protochlorophyllide a 8-vinyl-reductase
VGPNAAIQLAAALRDGPGPAAAEAVFVAAGLSDWLVTPPDALIAEADAARLFAQTRAALGAERADRVLADAGQRTGAYILAHRIPPMARRVLPLLPARLGAAILRRAIRGAAWTFAGSGRCTVAGGAALGRIEIADNPLSVPGAVWHRAVFDVLFGALVRGGAAARAACPAVDDCAGCGAQACVFTLHRPAQQKGRAAVRHRPGSAPPRAPAA